jgi:hypothetical protein
MASRSKISVKNQLDQNKSVVNLSPHLLPGKKNKFSNFPVIKPKTSSKQFEDKFDENLKESYENSLMKSIKGLSLQQPKKVSFDLRKYIIEEQKSLKK